MPSLPDSELDEAVSRATVGLRDLDAFTLRLASVRAVPRPERARMLWAGFDEGIEPSRGLSRAVRDSLGPYLQEDRRKPFAPHVTLARARRPRPCAPRALMAAEAALARSDDHTRSVSVASATLFRSTLSPQGPTYEVLAKLPFGSD